MRTTDKVQVLRMKRRVYQAQKTKEYKQRIAKYLSDEEKKILYSGEGFIRVPDEELSGKDRCLSLSHIII